MRQILLSIAFVLTVFTVQAQVTNQPDLAVYPNPSTEFISVVDQNDAVGHLAIFNLMGRKVREFEFNKHERYSVADLPKGLYLVQVQDKAGKTLVTHKLEKR
jgi:hypothetical protein